MIEHKIQLLQQTEGMIRLPHAFFNILNADGCDHTV